MTNLYEKLDQALREEDIEDLISSGAPADEYSYEAEVAAKILASMEDNLNVESIISAISDVWVQMFNRSPEEIEMRMPAFRNIAQKVMF